MTEGVTEAPVESTGPPGPPPTMWFSRRALKLHAVILIVVPAFMAMCLWQISRALGGNQLSWAYVFEWPIFAGYAVYMWWRLVHEAPVDTSPHATAPGPPGGTGRPAPAAPTNGRAAEGAPGDGTGDTALPASGTGDTALPASGTGDTALPASGTGDTALPASGTGADDEDAELAAYNAYLAQLAARDRAAGR